ncbi:uncharacterized, partial [Tachysurus ichikawai]
RREVVCRVKEAPALCEGCSSSSGFVPVLSVPGHADPSDDIPHEEYTWQCVVQMRSIMAMV